MVKFWPFGGDDTSAAGFERVLSALSDKINKTSAKDTRLRSNQRRARALWTLYGCFTYLVAALILVLVVGWQSWNALEYTALAGAPLLIYLGRLAIEAYYNYRLAGTQGHLDNLYKQRNDAISKLKAATKYDSTQQLLDRYGGQAPKAGSEQKEQEKVKPKSQQPSGVQRTGLPPPPTANIANRPSQTGARSSGDLDWTSTIAPGFDQTSDVSAEFAPNAFETASSEPAKPPASHSYETHASSPKWYDRLMDVILGEDEMQPRNRIVLLCAQCRLINGQAPPGIRSLEQLGRWKCMACGSMNGTASAAEQAVSEALTMPDNPAAANKTLSSSSSRSADILDEIPNGGEGNPGEDSDGGVAEALSASSTGRPTAQTRTKLRKK